MVKCYFSRSRDFSSKRGSKEIQKIGQMGDIAPGIVTGGNKFFILNQEQVNKYECILYTLPIVQKSSFILERIIEINEEAVNYIRDNGKPFYLLNLAEQKDIGALPEPLQNI